MKLYIATGSEHKKREMTEIFNQFEVVIPKDENIDFDPVENGSSFIENSLIKAKALWEITKQPVLADDSGICVEALDNRPGIYSARYAGKDFPKGNPSIGKLSSEEQNHLLIEEIRQLKDFSQDKKYKCHYVCAMVLYYGEDQFVCVQETLEGELITDINNKRGLGGFGYDPIVFVPQLNKTVAELQPEEKNAISHRGKAAKKILTFLLQK